MKTFDAVGRVSTSLPLVADDIAELHAARLLLLLKHCGQDGKINGLTKLAKLDFFVRYPEFFNRVAAHLGKTVSAHGTAEDIESPMVRHHYGPWDKRYYQVLAFLEGRGLIRVEKRASTYEFALTALGESRAGTISQTEAFSALVLQMDSVRKILGRKQGNQLKNLIYEVFDTEVRDMKLGAIIQ
jgi:hypothetical protein